MNESRYPDLQADPAAILEASAPVRAAQALIDAVGAAAPTSRGWQPIHRTVREWRALTPAARQFYLGVTLVVAPVAHILLSLWRGLDPGWLWLVIPVTAALVGGVCIVASRSGPGAQT